MSTVRAVMDTNVLYAGLYSAGGASFQVLRMIERQKLIPILSTTLLFEYEEILRRNQKLLHVSSRAIEDVLDGLCSRGALQRVFFLWRPQLADSKDDHLLELAIAAGGVAIITHNVRHFDAAAAFGIRVVRPAEMLRRLRKAR